MSTRTTLNERIMKRTQQGKKFIGTKMHIRAEMNRLSRQVRKLRDTEEEMAFIVSYNNVLALIKEAKR